MAIEALKKIFQIPVIKKEREVNFSPRGHKRPKPQKKDEKKDTGKIDIKI